MKKDSKRSVLILAAGTFTVFLEIGIIKGFSVLLPTLKEQFSTKTWIIGSSISIIYGWGYSLGLSASALKKRFGTRWCIMTCGMLSSVGIIVCILARDMYAFLPGLLLMGLMLPQENVAIGAIPDYFDKYYNVAVNVYCFGTAIAIMIFPPITQLLLDVYGWRGTMLIFCGINIHSIPCGALFRETKDDIKQCSINEFKDHSSGLEESYSFHSSIQKKRVTLLRDFGIDMILSPTFVLRVLLPGIVYGYTFSAWLIYIVSFALSFGMSLKEASIIATSGGIGIAAIRIALPFLNTIIPYRHLMYTSSLLMTISMVLATLLHSFPFLCISSMIYGLSIGMLGSEIYVAAKDIASEDQYVNAVAWFHLVDGFAMILGAAITGAIFDATGSFIHSFIILSAVSLGTFISLALEDIWMKLKAQRPVPL